MPVFGKSERTDEIYFYWIGRYVEWVKANFPPERYKNGFIDEELMRLYVDNLYRAGYAPSTINQAICALEAFAKRAGKLIKLPNRPHIEERIPPYLLEEEVEKLINGITDPRDRAFIALLVDTGLRLSEALQLDVDDVNLEERTVLVKSRKGGSPQVIPFSERTARFLREYLEIRKRMGIKDKALFLGTRGRLPVRTARDIVYRWSQRILGKRVHPHMLRHTCAVILRRRGVPLDIIKELLGHKSDIMTTRYARIVPTDLKKYPKTLDLTAEAYEYGEAEEKGG